MSNDSEGMMRVVARTREAILRLEEILNYRDDEWFVSRCRFCARNKNGMVEEAGLHVCDFDVGAAWSCARLFKAPEDEPKKFGTASLTDICRLAKDLDLGVELWADELNNGDFEHFCVDSTGRLFWQGGSGDDPDNPPIAGYGKFRDFRDIYRMPESGKEEKNEGE